MTTAQTLGGSLRRPGGAAPTRESTPVPAPVHAAQVVQCGPLPRGYPQNFELERSVGPKGRHPYSTATTLRVVDYTRLRCPDGGRRGKPRSGGRAWTGAVSEARYRTRSSGWVIMN